MHRVVLVLVVLTACSSPGTPIGATVFHYDAAGAIPPDVFRRVRPLAPVNDGCAVPLRGGKLEVRLANRSVRDPSTGKFWLQSVTVTVTKNADTRIDVEEVRPLLSATPETKSDGVSLRVSAHEVGGSFVTANVSIAGDGSCLPL